jgi:hypothetical protein
LEHPELPLAGKPDLVERVGSDIWVVDLKTGLAQQEPTPEQRVQLLFYCGLVEAKLKKMPAHAAIQTTGGNRHAFAVDAHEVEEVFSRAVAMLKQINASDTEGLDVKLASPSVEACGWCSFRPACRPFFDTYDETWELPHALLFEVESAEVSPHGHTLRAVVRRPHWREGEQVHVVGFPFDEAPEIGEVWGAINFAGRSSSAVAAWNTTMFKWT